MHEAEPVVDLLDEVLDVGHLQGLLHFFSLSQLVLQTALAILHHNILDESVLLVERIEKLNELHHVGGALEQRHDLVLARDHVASLLSALHCNFHVSVLVKCLEDVAWIISKLSNSFSVRKLNQQTYRKLRCQSLLKASVWGLAQHSALARLAWNHFSRQPFAKTAAVRFEPSNHSHLCSSNQDFAPLEFALLVLTAFYSFFLIIIDLLITQTI